VSARPRAVSLVPSASETLVALGVTPVACTRFCELPDVPTVGGTKRPDIDAIVASRPDLVVVNDEENRREDARLLEAAGLTLHSMSPRSVLDVGGAVRDLAAQVGAPVPAPFGPEAWEEWVATTRVPRRGRAFVAVWRRPWMSLAAETYGASLLALLGIGNVYDDARDRYPEVDLDAVAARAPDVIVLPSEPYVFTNAHVPEVVSHVPDTHVVLVDGRDLFWWGIRTPVAAARLAAALPSLSR
jgi:ABC-type Fe3+-hydroxamate transport system substrate-binding protein